MLRVAIINWFLIKQSYKSSLCKNFPKSCLSAGLFLIHSTTCRRVTETRDALCKLMGWPVENWGHETTAMSPHVTGKALPSTMSISVPTPMASRVPPFRPEGLTAPRASVPHEGAVADAVLQTQDEARAATDKDLCPHGHTPAAYLHTRDKSLEHGVQAKNVLCTARLSEEHGRRTHRMKTFSCQKWIIEVFSQSVGGKN